MERPLQLTSRVLIERPVQLKPNDRSWRTDFAPGNRSERAVGDQSVQNGTLSNSLPCQEQQVRSTDEDSGQRTASEHPASSVAEGPATILSGMGPRIYNPENGIDVGLESQEEGGTESEAENPPGKRGQTESAYVNATTGRHFASVSAGGTEVNGQGSNLTMEHASNSRAGKNQADRTCSTGSFTICWRRAI